MKYAGLFVIAAVLFGFVIYSVLLRGKKNTKDKDNNCPPDDMYTLW